MAHFLQLNLSVNAAILNCYGPHVIATTDSESLMGDMPVYTAGIGAGDNDPRHSRTHALWQ
jgi:hypothetical protein